MNAKDSFPYALLLLNSPFMEEKILTEQEFLGVEINNSGLNTERGFGSDKIFYSKTTTIKVHIFWEGHKILQNFTLLLTGTTKDKSKVKISQNFMAVSEYMNFSRVNSELHCFFYKINPLPFLISDQLSFWE